MSTIIKALSRTSDAPDESIRHVAFNFSDMSVRADQYIEQVRAQAAQIIQDAQGQAEAIHQQAEQRGRQAALDAVEKMTDEKVAGYVQTVLPALQKAIDEIEHAKQAWLAHWQRTGVQVAAAIAGRVIRREIAKTPEITLDLVRESLELAAGSTEMRIHLNPGDVKRLGKQVTELTRRFQPLSPAEVIADPSVTEGGCRVETKFGTIDQQFESQLERIEEELAES